VQSTFWIRILFVVPILALFLWSQIYWLLKIWRLAGRIGHPTLRLAARAVSTSAFLFVFLFLLFDAFLARRDILWRHAGIVGAVGLWVTSALWAFAGVQAVAAADWVWRLLSRLWRPAPSATMTSEAAVTESEPALVDPNRREFLQTATLIAGVLPFACGGYGFFVGRREYKVREITLPVSGWSQALDDFRIVQLSDIHAGSYMSVSEVGRIVGMANELAADLAVVTGDFLTGAGDPLEGCIRELSQLRAPLGIWGCNGNHEIYADAEEVAAKLFSRYGMDLLRQQSVELVRHSQRFNLIGVDYQRPRDIDDRALPMLAGVEPLVRRDVPNILLSHNPNAFPRAAELGIELTLAGHTHGGQVRIEILDRNVNPARFLTPYIAGLFKRPLGAGDKLKDGQAWSAAPSRQASLLYVNSGLGTIFAPVRLGVPPEISLFTLRRA
jgi:predicted MPP superfamily phosphohydrolase